MTHTSQLGRNIKWSTNRFGSAMPVDSLVNMQLAPEAKAKRYNASCSDVISEGWDSV
jgi:hypothetical protein